MPDLKLSLARTILAFDDFRGRQVSRAQKFGYWLTSWADRQQYPMSKVRQFALDLHWDHCLDCGAPLGNDPKARRHNRKVICDACGHARFGWGDRVE